jgi:hypothetical protein
MTNYAVTTNFASKDTLISGNPLKQISGAQLTTEFVNIAAAIGTKFDLNGASAVMNIPATNQQFVNSGAKIQRLNDRVMIGDACLNDGLFPNVTKDWLSAFQTSQAGGPANGTILGAQMASLGNSAWCGVGFLSGAQSLNIGATNVIANCSFAVNNTVSGATPAWAYYGEAHRMNNTAGQTVGFEIDVVQRGALAQNHPYFQSGGEVVGIICAAGAGMAATGQVAATAGLTFAANATGGTIPFDKGIIFQSTSIRGTDGVTGTGLAVNFAKGHVQQWWATGGIATGSIVGNGSTAAGAVGIDLDEGFLQITAAGGAAHTRFTGVPGAINYLNIFHGATANPIVVQTAGGDANVDLRVNCAGLGTILFGSSGLFSANTTVATALGSVGPAGAHTTVQTWLTIKDNTGTIRYIPCF